jgi:small conductance mechanosensitive channel
MKQHWCHSLGPAMMAKLPPIAGALALLLLLLTLAAAPGVALAQDGTPTAPGDDIEAPDRVDVVPRARDEQISQRLQSIYEATGWFASPTVVTEQGVVFLGGQTTREEYRTWAGDLARRTQDVVAVVNQIEVVPPPVWDFDPALAGLYDQIRRIVRTLPLLLFSILILAVAWVIARFFAGVTRRSMRRRQLNQLLVNVLGRGVALLIFLLGMYVVFQIAGLSSVALGILGGTGILGLILGIAFQDIVENFLASILLSFQSPYHSGDLVQIEDVTGFVQIMTLRTTVLMTQDGNHVQIPNATVYKSKITNFTSNPNRRADFMVGIGYDESTADVQALVLDVLREHPAVLQDPEPMVLVENLGAATVNLRIYFWIDGAEYSFLKVKSSVIRLVKRALQEAGISMPGEVRELVFPDAVSVQQLDAGRAGPPLRETAPTVPRQEPARVTTEAEGGLRSEAGDIEQQARTSRPPEEGANLLERAAEE